MANHVISWYNGAQRHFQQYFSDIVAVSFIGGGNQSIHRKPPLLSYTQQNQDTPRIGICFLYMGCLVFKQI
jgi:hypothetical protein